MCSLVKRDLSKRQLFIVFYLTSDLVDVFIKINVKNDVLK